MKLAVNIQVEELPEGVFVVKSDDLHGLVAQGRTSAEALEFAGDVARKRIESKHEHGVLLSSLRP